MSDELSRHEVHCVSAGSEPLCRETRLIVREAPLTIEITDGGKYTLMCTPGNEMELAAGFAFAEGLINSCDDIGLLMRCPDNPNIIRMQLTDSRKAKENTRNTVIVSSCGNCGSEDIEKSISQLPSVPDELRIPNKDLTKATEILRSQQRMFEQTGGTHAAGLIREGEILAIAEDIGRHNALDKAIGSCLLRRIETKGMVAALSGRISWEMVLKVARAGVELIAAVSAPTTLAIEAAQRANITLCGFVRGDRATVYSHPHRIIR